MQKQAIGMRVLVIGGTGFVGPHVVRQLAGRGCEVTLFHRGRTEADLPAGIAHIHGDREALGEHRAAFERIRPEVVLDLRPLVEQHAQAVMETFRGLAGRVVAVSSGDVYRAYGRLQGTEPGPLEPVPLREDAPLRERLYPYRGLTPRAAEDPRRWLDDYDKILVERAVLGEPELPGTVLRLPMVYGSGDDLHRLFPYLKRMDDERPAILLDEAMAPWRWTRGYVEDVADAIVAAVLDGRSSGRIYNVGEADTLTELEWTRTIAEAAGWRGSLVTLSGEQVPGWKPGLNFQQHLVMDTSRIRNELNYREATPREEALARTVAWERAHPPKHIDMQEFDYAAEDRVLARLHLERGPR